MKEIAILRTGRYTDANGNNYDITPSMLEDMAKNTKQGSAPLVKGHPQAEAPAMGWVDNLRVVGNSLMARFNKIAPEFGEEVKAENFKNVSASFFQPYAPSNPKQGHYVLRHVGALGAARPAIPGLGTLQEALAFCEQDDGIVALSENASPEASFMEKLALLFNPEKLREQLRQELLAEFSDTMSRMSHASGMTQHATSLQENKQEEASMDARVAELEKQLEASKAELAKEKAERERLSKEAETAQAKGEVSAELEKLGESKEISPEQKEGLINKALDLVGAGKKPAEAVAAFGEYFPDKKAPRKNWGDRTQGRGMADFSEKDNPALSPEFSAKKAEFEKQGLSSAQAYDRAMQEVGGK